MPRPATHNDGLVGMMIISKGTVMTGKKFLAYYGCDKQAAVSTMVLYMLVSFHLDGGNRVELTGLPLLMMSKVAGIQRVNDAS